SFSISYSLYDSGTNYGLHHGFEKRQ
ncbi:SIS domain protein, partial [Chlamydia psittaci 84-8471/1]